MIIVETKPDIVALAEGGKMVTRQTILHTGRWTHPKAPNGVLEVTNDTIDRIKQNFDLGVGLAGNEMPAHIGHTEHVDDAAAGWARLEVAPDPNKPGANRLVAICEHSDPSMFDKVKNKVYRYTSPTLVFGYKDRRLGKTFDVAARNFAYTNYPFLQGMGSAEVVNMSEVRLAETAGDGGSAQGNPNTDNLPTGYEVDKLPKQCTSCARLGNDCPFSDKAAATDLELKTAAAGAGNCPQYIEASQNEPGGGGQDDAQAASPTSTRPGPVQMAEPAFAAYMNLLQLSGNGKTYDIVVRLSSGGHLKLGVTHIGILSMLHGAGGGLGGTIGGVGTHSRHVEGMFGKNAMNKLDELHSAALVDKPSQDGGTYHQLTPKGEATLRAHFGGPGVDSSLYNRAGYQKRQYGPPNPKPEAWPGQHAYHAAQKAQLTEDRKDKTMPVKNSALADRLAGYERDEQTRFTTRLGEEHKLTADALNSITKAFDASHGTAVKLSEALDDHTLALADDSIKMELPATLNTVDLSDSVVMSRKDFREYTESLLKAPRTEESASTPGATQQTQLGDTKPVLGKPGTGEPNLTVQLSDPKIEPADAIKKLREEHQAGRVNL